MVSRFVLHTGLNDVDSAQYLGSQNARTQDKGEGELVFLKEGATNVAVNAVGEVVVEEFQPLFQIF